MYVYVSGHQLQNQQCVQGMAGGEGEVLDKKMWVGTRNSVLNL